ncbi:hypothetical protein ACJX0J_017957 [Zea mays]
MAILEQAIIQTLVIEYNLQIHTQQSTLEGKIKRIKIPIYLLYMKSTNTPTSRPISKYANVESERISTQPILRVFESDFCALQLVNGEGCEEGKGKMILIHTQNVTLTIATLSNSCSICYIFHLFVNIGIYR